VNRNSQLNANSNEQGSDHLQIQGRGYIALSGSCRIRTPQRGVAAPAIYRFLFLSIAQSCCVSKPRSRLQVQKTYKLFIGGKFVRGENGRVLAARGADGEFVANFCRASKKDFRDAVVAARAAFPNWSKQSAYMRGQILYRAAEMLEMRQTELTGELARVNGARTSISTTQVTHAIDRLVHYAGWTDKFIQVFGSVNPVASSHFNFTKPEPTGVVVVLCPDEPALLGFVSLVAPVILSGNCAVVLPSTTNSLPALTFSEIIATSDLPPGVVNVLAGDRVELTRHFSSHMDVNAIVDGSGDEEIGRELQKGGELNVKRYVRRELTPAQWRSRAAENPYWILDTVEMKTAWHPIGL
jgi:delta 1-pyrroline-5-carboxylate dehydrogenase